MLDHLEPAVEGGDVQRCGLNVRPCMHISAAVEQQAYLVRVRVRVRVRVCAAVQQEAHLVRVRVRVRVRVICPPVQQQAHRLGARALRRGVQCGPG